MEHSVTEEGGALVASLRGDVDLEHSPKAREVLLDCVKRGQKVLVLEKAPFIGGRTLSFVGKGNKATVDGIELDANGFKQFWEMTTMTPMPRSFFPEEGYKWKKPEPKPEDFGHIRRKRDQQVI